MYSPQLIENYTLKSGEGLSVAFVVIWLIGDLTNFVGAILAHLLFTVIVLAVYVCYSQVYVIPSADRPLVSTLYAIQLSFFRFITIAVLIPFISKQPPRLSLRGQKRTN